MYFICQVDTTLYVSLADPSHGRPLFASGVVLLTTYPASCCVTKHHEILQYLSMRFASILEVP